MAYNRNGLSVVAVAGNSGFTGWHYETEDEWNLVRQPDYWESAEGLLRAGDAVYVTCKNFGRPFYPHVRVHKAPDGDLHLQ